MQHQFLESRVEGLLLAIILFEQYRKHCLLVKIVITFHFYLTCGQFVTYQAKNRKQIATQWFAKAHKFLLRVVDGYIFENVFLQSVILFLTASACFGKGSPTIWYILKLSLGASEYKEWK